MKNRILSLSALCLILSFYSALSVALEKSDKIRLHVMNCGHMEISNMASFSDTGEYEGKLGSLEDPCFLIQHPKGLLIWDTGLGDNLIGITPPKENPFQPTVAVSLTSQLKKLGLAPKDIQFMAFSHTHFDHTGNANQFLAATWLLQEKEFKDALSENPLGMKPETFDQYSKVKKMTFRGDYDVFGDGRVMILSTPGHTPGHQSLLVKLSGKPVILSGDLYHFKENRTHKRVPLFNTNRADTLASMDRIETIANNLGARVIIQHDPLDYASLPKYPEFLE